MIKRPCSIEKKMFTVILDGEGQQILICGNGAGVTNDEVALEVLAALTQAAQLREALEEILGTNEYEAHRIARETLASLK